MFEIVNELPPEFKPSIVTLSAPFRSINGKPARRAGDRSAPVGVIMTEVYRAPPAGVQYRRPRSLIGIAANANANHASVRACIDRSERGLSVA